MKGICKYTLIVIASMSTYLNIQAQALKPVQGCTKQKNNGKLVYSKDGKKIHIKASELADKTIL